MSDYADSTAITYDEIFAKVQKEADFLRRFEICELQLSMGADKSIKYSELMQWDGEEFIRKLYNELLLREPYPADIDHYMQRLNGGDSKQAVLLSFMFSKEKIIKGVKITEIPPLELPENLFFREDDEYFVLLAFRWLLQKDPEKEGLRDYVVRLDEGLSRSKILLEIENRSDATHKHHIIRPEVQKPNLKQRISTAPVVGKLAVKVHNLRHNREK